MAGSVCPTHATKIAITVRLEIVIADQPAREADQDRREAARSPFSAPSASVISASSTSCSAVRTSARRNSSSSLRRALTSIVPDLPCLLVMVCILAKGSGDCPSPAYHDHPRQRLLQNFPDTTGVTKAGEAQVGGLRGPHTGVNVGQIGGAVLT